MKYQKIVRDALRPVFDFLLENEPQTQYNGPEVEEGKHLRLRFDWAIADEGETSFEHRVEIMFNAFVDDFANLIENGDRSLLDPLFSATNGSKIRNQEPIEVLFPHAKLYKQYNSKHKLTEYIIYFNMAIIWSD